MRRCQTYMLSEGANQNQVTRETTVVSLQRGWTPLYLMVCSVKESDCQHMRQIGVYLGF